MHSKDEKWLIEEKYGGQPSPACDADLARLRAGEPLAYIIGFVPFLGLRIYLDSKPLIPRPETEWWAEKMIEKMKENNESKDLSLLDLCAGSGAVGCAVLTSIPDAHVSFGEIDSAHETTIRKNIDANGLDASRVDIRIGDLFAPFPGMRFDFIAANPPYIPEGRALDASVALHEPALALRSGEDGLELIRRIAREAPDHMNPGGELWLECDSAHADEARSLVAKSAKRAELIPDQFGQPRLVVGYF